MEMAAFKEMTMLITPRTALEIVLAKKAKDKKSRPYETRIQKIFFFGVLFTLIVGVGAAIASMFWQPSSFPEIAVIAIFLATLLVIGYQITSISPELKKFRNLEREFSSPFVNQFNDDLDLINEVASLSKPHHLIFIENSFRLRAKQLRERIAILVGALDKVGVIPLALTAYLSMHQFYKKEGILVGGIEWLSVALVVLYLVALRMTEVAQWLERTAEIFAQANAIHSQNENRSLHPITAN